MKCFCEKDRLCVCGDCDKQTISLTLDECELVRNALVYFAEKHPKVGAKRTIGDMLKLDRIVLKALRAAR